MNEWGQTKDEPKWTKWVAVGLWIIIGYGMYLIFRGAPLAALVGGTILWALLLLHVLTYEG